MNSTSSNSAHGLLGRHYLAEFSECPSDRISTVVAIESLFIRALKSNGATVLDHTSHQFEPAGATLVVLLAESHASLHTWPEKGSVCIDMFTCGEALDAAAALEQLAEALRAGKKEIKVVERTVPR